MPPIYSGGSIRAYYRQFWRWFYSHHNLPRPQLYGGGARGFTTDQNWGGYPFGSHGIWIGLAFSGTGRNRRRVVKIEAYSDDIHDPNWQIILQNVQAGTAAVNLWTQLTNIVHRHRLASAIRTGPGVYSIRNARGIVRPAFAATAVPQAGGPVPNHPSFGKRPTQPEPQALSIERCGKAGRVCAFHEDAFNLRDAADVQRMADWMHQSLLVYTAALAQVLP